MADRRGFDPVTPTPTSNYTVDVDAGGAAWVDTANTMFAGMDVATLGNNLTATVDGNTVTFGGSLDEITDWTAFSSVESDRTGYYAPFHIEVEDDDDPTATVWMYRATANGGAGKWVPVNSNGISDGGDLIFAVDPDNPVIVGQLQSGTTTKPTALDADAEEITLDFSGVTFNAA